MPCLTSGPSHSAPAAYGMVGWSSKASKTTARGGRRTFEAMDLGDHAPPADLPTSWGGKRFFGDVELVQWIKTYQPSMVITATCINRPSFPTARGSTGSATPGFSMPACSPAVRRSISCWISTTAGVLAIRR